MTFAVELVLKIQIYIKLHQCLLRVNRESYKGRIKTMSEYAGPVKKYVHLFLKEQS